MLVLHVLYDSWYSYRNNLKAQYFIARRTTHDWQCNNNGDYDNIEAPADFVTEHNWGISPLILGHPNRP